ncbi:MAG TPA: hypothetical protein VK431_06645 [Nitrosopumilaceae archaeon]|nr:hypothetical protein [Nitrosopumilaceae archaeon]
MTSMNKNVALLMGLAAIASVSTAYAFMQDVQSPKGIQAEHSGMLGHLQLVLYGPDGQIKSYRQTDNIVVINGDNATANKMFFGSTTGGRKLTTCGGGTCSGNSVGTFQWIGVGTSNTGATATDSALGSQQSNKKLGTVTNGTGGHGTAQIQVTFPANKLTNSSTVNIQEAGLFDGFLNSSASSNMFSRQTFSAIGVNPADTLQITWTISIT